VFPDIKSAALRRQSGQRQSSAWLSGSGNRAGIDAHQQSVDRSQPNGAPQRAQITVRVDVKVGFNTILRA
jgi:hypothetical protein